MWFDLFRNDHSNLPKPPTPFKLFFNKLRSNGSLKHLGWKEEKTEAYRLWQELGEAEKLKYKQDSERV